MPGTHDPIDRYFELSLFSLFSVGFLTLAGTGKMDFVTVLVMSLALATRAALLWRNSSFQLSPRVASNLTIAYVVFFFLDLLFFVTAAETLLERLLLATIHLILFTAIIKMFSARQPRDSVYLAALAFAQMLAAATLTVQTSFLFYFGLFLLLAIATFTSFEIKRARDRVLDSPPPPSPKLASALTGTSTVICCGTVVLAAFLFFVIPRGSRGYFSAYGQLNERMTGFSENVELGTIGQIKQSSTVIMHIEAPNLSPARAVKWRGVGLTNFNGKRWFNRGIPSEAVTGFRRFQLARQLTHSGMRPELLDYTVMLQPLASNVLFVATQPLELTGPFRRLWQDETGSIFVSSVGGTLIRYAALSDIQLPTPEMLREDSAPVPDSMRDTYLQLPPLDPRISRLALEITESQSSTYDKAKAVEEHLQANYGYTLDLPAAMPDDPIAYFLFSVRRGHCEFFASAMAVLLRSAGIPSRLVNGFLQGAYNDVSGEYAIRASDAHTWVEVYFPTYGWITFDPTPPEGRAVQGLWLGRLSLYMDAFHSFWDEWVINYDFLHQATLARQLERASREWRNDSRQLFRQRYRYLVGVVRQGTEDLLRSRELVLMLLSLSLAGFAALYWRSDWRLWLRQRRMLQHARQGTATPEDATLAYLFLLRVLARRGMRKSPAQTPHEFANSLPEPAGPLVRRFTDLYVGSRFGQLPELLPSMTSLLENIRFLRRGR
ncbi:MAG: DUF3488 domain-containing protein [Acidobacteria bacterium]|nr:DUF3488 domain-containing protein [Acidobacteriota bacterium]